MNRTLFVSVHLAIGAAIAAGFVFWLVSAQYAMGRGAGSNDAYLLWSGWIALALYLVVVAYSLRKYVHKLCISPEFKMKVPLDQLERTEKAINDLRRQVFTGVVTTEADIRTRADRLLRDHGAHKILKVVVRPGEPGEPKHVLEVQPTEPLGRVAKWLHAHLYYGVAAGVLVWLHGGGSFDPLAHPMGFLLNVTSYLVIVTGLVGIVLWAIGPSMMTAKETDLSIEEAFVMESSLSERIRRVLDELEPSARAVVRDAMKARGDFRARAAAALDALVKQQPDQEAHMRDVLALVGQHHRVSRGLAGMKRVKLIMNWWRAIHVPVSIFLMGLLVVHVVSVWWY